MTLLTEEQWALPVGLKHQAVRALMFNRRLLECLKRYPSPTGLSDCLVSAISHKLGELRELNNQIAAKCSGWLDCGEG
jgi:hypothetical protein